MSGPTIYDYTEWRDLCSRVPGATGPHELVGGIAGQQYFDRSRMAVVGLWNYHSNTGYVEDYYGAHMRREIEMANEIALRDTTKTWYAVLKANAGWQGPYPTLEAAQQEAARCLAREGGWEQYHVVQLVGTVMKPLPDMMWKEPAPPEVGGPATPVKP